MHVWQRSDDSAVQGQRCSRSAVFKVSSVQCQQCSRSAVFAVSSVQGEQCSRSAVVMVSSLQGQQSSRSAVFKVSSVQGQQCSRSAECKRKGRGVDLRCRRSAALLSAGVPTYKARSRANSSSFKRASDSCCTTPQSMSLQDLV